MRVASKTEIESFLSEVFSILNDSYKSLYIAQRTHSEDKTQLFRDTFGFTHEMICEEILKLKVSNYSYTDLDNGVGRKGEIWFFGMDFYPSLKGEKIEIYIKLKLQRGVICLSFHPAEYPMRYSY